MPGKFPDSLVLRSPAKINLFLHVTGKRDDGYHELETVFQFLDFHDLLRFELTGESGIVRIDDHPYALPQSDLIIRSSELLASTQGLKNPAGVKVTLTKVIPPGSGMGGGSSNAATTRLFQSSNFIRARSVMIWKPYPEACIPKLKKPLPYSISTAGPE